MRTPARPLCLLPAALSLLLTSNVFALQHCDNRPAVDSPQATHPYGPVDPSDSTPDWIELLTNRAFDLQFSLDGLDHASSLPIASQFQTVGAFATSLVPGPSPLFLGGSKCAPIWLYDPQYRWVNQSTLSWVDLGFTTNLAVGSRFGIPFQTVQYEPATSRFTTSDVASLWFTQGPLLEDPEVAELYPCIQVVDETVSGIQGRIYWPGDCAGGAQPPGVLPLVIFLPGDGFLFSDYDYLLEHLAKNGFIAVSISRGDSSNSEGSARIMTWLDYMRGAWQWSSYVENKVALAGHSRGGNTIFAAARLIQEDPALDHDVHSLVALAPSDRNEAETMPPESLTGAASRSLLVLYGSGDNDVFGWCSDCVSGAPPQVPSSPFPLYDRAGTEGSTVGPIPTGSGVDKAMVFIAGANHSNFADTLTEQNEQRISKAYVSAFLRWHLMGEDLMAPYIRGEWDPAVIQETDTRIMQQYSPAVGRRVIDNFENGLGFEFPTLGTAISSPGIAIFSKGPLTQANASTAISSVYSCPHDTNGLHLRWTGGGSGPAPFVRWNLPGDAPPIFQAPYRDLSGFGALSIRVGQVYESVANTPGESTAIQMRLVDGTGKVSPLVWLDAFADLGYPQEEILFIQQPPLGTVQGNVTKSSMTTARIPLRYFDFDFGAGPSVDLTDIRHIDLVFASPDHPTGEIVIDSLELVP